MNCAIWFSVPYAPDSVQQELIRQLKVCKTNINFNIYQFQYLQYFNSQTSLRFSKAKHGWYSCMSVVSLSGHLCPLSKDPAGPYISLYIYNQLQLCTKSYYRYNLHGCRSQSVEIQESVLNKTNTVRELHRIEP
ncbi:Hypothetical_protein [Hexamita inflata]|uniref:Hypothetical_protein n=1 Tax=Hexamita inflata TaxID=28002 RepID=A0AA86NDL1_9EUKA|nr:Hypothetical protein HINF_LOCUS5021 [Hexamita inflata]